MWREVDAPAVDAYLAACEQECGGRTARGCLHMTEHPMIVEYFERLGDVEFGHMVLFAAAVDATSPPTQWENVNRFFLAGAGADHLHTGAGSPAGQGARHMGLATAAVAGLVGDRYDDLAVWFTDETLWSPWFAYSDWSGTWLIADRAGYRVHILCMTVD